MFALRDGRMMLVPYDKDDSSGWFTFEEVKKPKFTAPYWEDETVFAINKLPGVATYMPYASEAEMKADADYYKTPWTEPKSTLYKSLDGTWNFWFTSVPEKGKNAATGNVEVMDVPAFQAALAHANGNGNVDCFAREQ